MAKIPTDPNSVDGQIARFSISPKLKGLLLVVAMRVEVEKFRCLFFHRVIFKITRRKHLTAVSYQILFVMHQRVRECCER